MRQSSLPAYHRPELKSSPSEGTSLNAVKVALKPPADTLDMSVPKNDGSAEHGGYVLFQKKEMVRPPTRLKPSGSSIPKGEPIPAPESTALTSHSQDDGNPYLATPFQLPSPAGDHPELLLSHQQHASMVRPPTRPKPNGSSILKGEPIPAPESITLASLSQDDGNPYLETPFRLPSPAGDHPELLLSHQQHGQHESNQQVGRSHNQARVATLEKPTRSGVPTSPALRRIPPFRTSGSQHRLPSSSLGGQSSPLEPMTFRKPADVLAALSPLVPRRPCHKRPAPLPSESREQSSGLREVVAPPNITPATLPAWRCIPSNSDAGGQSMRQPAWRSQPRPRLPASGIGSQSPASEHKTLISQQPRVESGNGSNLLSPESASPRPVLVHAHGKQEKKGPKPASVTRPCNIDLPTPEKYDKDDCIYEGTGDEASTEDSPVDNGTERIYCARGNQQDKDADRTSDDRKFPGYELSPLVYAEPYSPVRPGGEAVRVRPNGRKATVQKQPVAHSNGQAHYGISGLLTPLAAAPATTAASDECSGQLKNKALSATNDPSLKTYADGTSQGDVHGYGDAATNAEGLNSAAEQPKPAPCQRNPEPQTALAPGVGPPVPAHGPTRRPVRSQDPKADSRMVSTQECLDRHFEDSNNMAATFTGLKEALQYFLHRVESLERTFEAEASTNPEKYVNPPGDSVCSDSRCSTCRGRVWKAQVRVEVQEVLDQFQRESNIIVTGLVEEDGKDVLAVCRSIMPEDACKFVSAERLGQPSTDCTTAGPRPVRVRCMSKSAKLSTRKRRVQLQYRGQNVHLNNDLTPAQQRKRREVLPTYKALRAKNVHCKLPYDEILDENGQPMMEEEIKAHMNVSGGH